MVLIKSDLLRLACSHLVTSRYLLLRPTLKYGTTERADKGAPHNVKPSPNHSNSRLPWSYLRSKTGLNTYSLSSSELGSLHEFLDKHLTMGFICPSSSAHAAPVLFVRKKDGSLCLCIDFQGLNKITKKDRSHSLTSLTS